MNKNACYIVGIMTGRPPTKDATDFGKRVAAARRERGLTQRELAEHLGISQKMVEYYERRASNVTADVVCKLSEVLHVTADELLGTSPQKARPGPKSRLQRQIEQIERLPQSKQNAIVQVLDMALQRA